MSEILRVQRDDRLLLLTLHRPERRNALSVALCEALSAALEEAQRDAGVGAVLLTGAGESFCSGLDFEDEEALRPEVSAAAFARLFRTAGSLERPLVAAVQGAVLGGGVLLTACAHVVVAAQGTSFGVTGIRSGIFPAIGFLPLARAIGERRALEVCLTGRIFSAPEAQQWGLVTQVAPPFEYDDRADAIARQLAHASPGAVEAAFRFFKQCRTNSEGEIWQAAQREHAKALSSPDFAEGWRAWKEGRTPQWAFPKT